MARCEVCFRHCEIREGARGFCGARICRGGKIVADNYGRVTSLALDPIEKKPLNRFFPGSMILSVGSYGCNLRCPFCQNSEISWGEEAIGFAETAQEITPEELADAAVRLKAKGNIGVAFTYNEPLIGYEFVRDTAKLVQKAGLKNVMVTNGTAELAVLSEILPFIDAMNVDLKCFSKDTYKDVLGGDFEMVKAFIREAAKYCHVELTTLIVPGMNDSPEEMRELTAWIRTLDADIPLHISRFFPRFHMQDRKATDVDRIYELAELAHEDLKYVYTGNC
ncbi:MAG: AmmeMemoRadiSam system radical SAM enzyme [Clostridiales bacterium]|nr:AmmeMemoRadiSam system radical SAM enzyme [Clostridiales bacterium]